ncbi:MAG: cytidine deaminase [Bacteroidales bacterium]|nr:cytidine deaminase [Bacteroidales bacterium]MBQ1912011.1 cytidine deaminase [Bacteroidales bacterium]
MEQRLTIDYQEFDSPQQMSAEDQALITAAFEAKKGSYSPYSHFQVGAALLLEDGTVVHGANQENVAYPSGLCAERTAMFAAGANYPALSFRTLAIVASDHGVTCDYPASPCGSCRQVMAEYQKKQGKPFSIILIGDKRIRKFARVDDLLPFIFDSLD